jgi:hypothetical protein
MQRENYGANETSMGYDCKAMGDPAPEQKRRGNPAMVKGGPSLNPKGRPRAGLALAERIRERLDPDTLLNLAMRVAEDETLSDARKIEILLPLYDRGYVKPPTTIAAQVHTTSSPSRDYSQVPLEERRALLEQIRSLGRVTDPKVLDGEAVVSPALVAHTPDGNDEE